MCSRKRVAVAAATANRSVLIGACNWWWNDEDQQCGARIQIYPRNLMCIITHCSYSRNENYDFHSVRIDLRILFAPVQDWVIDLYRMWIWIVKHRRRGDVHYRHYRTRCTNLHRRWKWDLNDLYKSREISNFPTYTLVDWFTYNFQLNNLLWNFTKIIVKKWKNESATFRRKKRVFFEHGK